MSGNILASPRKNVFASVTISQAFITPFCRTAESERRCGKYPI